MKVTARKSRTPRVACISIVWAYDENPDLSWLGEFTDTWKEQEGTIEHRERTGGNAREHRYFIPARPESAEKDYRRMLDYGNGWWMIGCYAIAEVSYPISNTGTDRRIERLQSSGLWGIESDSDHAYFHEVEENELADLREHLRNFKVDQQNFSALAKDAPGRRK